MSNEINVYKMMSSTPSIYTEVNENRGKFDLSLMSNNEVIEKISGTQCGQTFYINAPGTYTVLVNYTDGKYTSNEVIFQPSEFMIEKVAPLFSMQENKLSALSEPVINENDKFSIQIKINKGKKSKLDKLLKKERGFFDLEKVVIDLSSFQKDHPIHNFEYYTLKSTLSVNNVKIVADKLEKDSDIIYVSITPDEINLLEPTKSEQEIFNVNNTTTEVTPDLSSYQKYLDEPHGMNVRNAWARGNTGQLAVIRHIDFGVNSFHEDLQNKNITIVTNKGTTKEEILKNSHGTGSIGVISAEDNGFGMTGIAHSAKLYSYYIHQMSTVLSDSRPGDIVSYEYCASNHEKKMVPASMYKSFWDTIYNLTQKGVIVLNTAGNANVNLSDPSQFIDYGDNGGILVGACMPNDGSKAGFSNYGHSTSLVNSWGYEIATTGSGTLYIRNNDKSTAYSAKFNGTSGAAPLCAAALGLLQSHAKSMGVMLTPESMRTLLKKSSYTEGVKDGIGVRPNVAQLMRELDKEILAPLVNINPFSYSSNYLNLNSSFKIDEYKIENLPFYYQYTDLKHNGIIAHYPQQAPSELEWWNQVITVSEVKIPISDSDGNVSVLYLAAHKWNDAGRFTLNTATAPGNDTGGNFRIQLRYDPEKNTHLNKTKYSGIFPVYIQCWEHREYKLPVRINIHIE
ncbi:S8 family serine peptidase [Proteus sp. ZN5]|uniref:S8 family serine peptidase n=1 Tax=Proteus sp. ZN5 TaxID=2697019 RepID=UPI0013E197CF|nr:S8 family serine peptidase [Proteus sp. ZN5]QIG06704.1 S8 family serine peptidase [Proteus sp. ZN5]